MRRLTYISYDRFWAAKGASVHIAAFSQALAKAYGHLFLVTLESAEPIKGPDLPGVTHHPLQSGGPHLVGQVMNFRNALGHWLSQQPQSDVIHVRSPFEGYPVARAHPHHARHLVYEVNGVPSIELKYHHPGVDNDLELMRKLQHQEQVLMEAADLLITPSGVTAQYLKRRGVPEHKIRVIPNGVDLDTFSYKRPPEASDTKRMLYVGTLTGWQGLGSILQALACLRQRMKVELVVIGSARQRQQKRLLEEAQALGVSDIVTWLAPMSQADVALWHHRCDVALAPLVTNDRNLEQGCCPLKVLEAMAAGTPVVASDLPVLSELVTHNVHGILVPPGNTAALTEALASLLADPDRRLRLSLAARARIEAQFTWAHAQAALIKSYEGLFNASANAAFNASASLPA